MKPKAASRLPVIGEYVRHHGTLIAIEEVPKPPQPPPEREYIFSEISAHWEVRLNSNKLKDGNSLNDFYGKGTSVEGATEEAKSWAERNSITPESDLEVVVIKTVSNFRALLASKENFYDPSFVDFEPLRNGSRRGVMPDVVTVEWSSKHP